MQDDINNANSSINNNSDSNNNNSEDELKKKQQKDSETKTSGQLAKTGLSAAASAFGTPLAGKVVNVASNILPDELVGKAANIASPSLKQASKAIEKTGLSNEINQGLKLASGGLSKDGTLPKDSINSNKQQLQTPNNTSDNKQTSNGINVNTDGINKSESSDATSSGGSKSSKSKSNWLILTMIGGPGCALLFPMIIVLFIIMVYVADLLGIATNANNFINNGISGVINNIVNFILPGEQATLEQQFYQELYDIQEEIEADTGICIDINLIVASLKVDSFFQDIIIDGESDEVNGTKLDYKKMIKQVELLANMQIKRKKYGWDSRLGNNIHCIDGTKDEYELVNSENQGYFVNPAIFGENGKDSSTAEEVSKHDADSYFNFFTKDAAKEKNYEYWIYRPI